MPEINTDRQEQISLFAKSIVENSGSQLYELQTACTALNELGYYKNSPEPLHFCRERIDKITAENLHKSREAEKQQVQEKSKSRKNCHSSGACAAGAVGGGGSGCMCGDAAAVIVNQYRTAVQLRESGKYGEASEIFSSHGDYEDCKEQLQETDYIYAEELMDE